MIPDEIIIVIIIFLDFEDKLRCAQVDKRFYKLVYKPAFKMLEEFEIFRKMDSSNRFDKYWPVCDNYSYVSKLMSDSKYIELLLFPFELVERSWLAILLNQAMLTRKAIIFKSTWSKIRIIHIDPELNQTFEKEKIFIGMCIRSKEIPEIFIKRKFDDHQIGRYVYISAIYENYLMTNYFIQKIDKHVFENKIIDPNLATNLFEIVRYVMEFASRNNAESFLKYRDCAHIMKKYYWEISLDSAIQANKSENIKLIESLGWK